ncbi:glyceraldehyde-3-phosphate dehydrogenase [Evansella sp. AB-P1]|uniref:glyceraldehyde-3-phosphate dehydrogenase n=1 Tax=Evansella sp. AB-P1 TaxID=3037653 RepID=UPI00241EFF53|nr:glyceraldehyde-3-phosphate dehydrogenase [Evansella sp. AB-P1]MDG5786964.1 glyceraldehyde-3-phosphate dehydrogenase [Evansella sp. AB-P1]
MARIAINGFGRIGRLVFRKALSNPALQITAVNACYPAETLCHLIKYDTIHGPFRGDVKVFNNNLLVNGNEIKLFQSRDPLKLPWEEEGIDIVVEATGKFKTREGASLHLEAGAKKVVITAPGKGEDATIVYGVNEDKYNSKQHHIISNASCTTNCLAPIAKVLNEFFHINYGLMTTVHSYTNDQKNIDNPHQDLRRARACGQSIIPTSTGAAKAISKVLPELEGKLNGLALRVPTPNVSLVDLNVEVNQKVNKDLINNVFQIASEKSMRGIIDYTDSPLVSSDFNGNEHSAIIDGLSTLVINERQVKVLAWYDNEWGYSCRVVNLVQHIAEKLKFDLQINAS